MNRHSAVVLILLLAAIPASAATLNVPGSYPTIQAAVDAASSGDIIQVAAGTYTDLHTRQSGAVIDSAGVFVKSGITIRGAGIGSTIVDQNLLGRGFHCENVTNVLIRDMTIRRASMAVYGSGVFMKTNSSVSIFNCELKDCRDGGAIYLDGSGGSLSSCTVTNNLSKQGGGIAMENGCSPTIINCTISGNVAPVAGGLFIRNLCAPRVENCTISGNHLNSPNGAGGGVAILNSSPTIIGTKILNNVGDGIGGGVEIVDNSNVTMTNCVVQGNSTSAAYGPGGGIYIEFSSLTMENGLITHNTTGLGSDGAGLYAFFANTLLLRQVTIANNQNTGAPGGIAGVAYFLSQSQPILDKSIVAFNGPGMGMGCLDSSDNPLVSCCDVYGNTGGNLICGTNGGHNFSLDPLFCDMANDNYRLQMTSPCYPGHHPDGGFSCNRDRIGGADPGCNPADVDESASLPSETRLVRNLPNPFHPPTTIEYEIAQSGRVVLRVFDISGRQVRSLTDTQLPAGRYTTQWDGRDEQGHALPSGVYFYRLGVNGIEASRRMVLTR